MPVVQTVHRPAGASTCGTVTSAPKTTTTSKIEVAEVESLYAKVQAAGALVYLPLEDNWYRRGEMLLGNRQFIVQDPDGYLLRLFEDLGSRPAIGPQAA